MGFIYQEANAYGVEALVALERHYTPHGGKILHRRHRGRPASATPTASRAGAGAAGAPYRRRRGVPAGAPVRGRGDAAIPVHSSLGSNTCLAWFLVWDYVRPGGEKAYKYTGHTPQQRLRDIISAVGQYQEDPLPAASSWTPSATSSTTWTSPACPCRPVATADAVRPSGGVRSAPPAASWSSPPPCWHK